MKFLEQRGLTWAGALRLVQHNIRDAGLRVTLKKAIAQLGRTDVDFDIDRYEKWFERHITDPCSAGNALFEQASVVIVGALDIPQCKKYRVMQKAEYFANHEIQCSYSEYRDLTRAFSLMQLASVVIFYRIPAGPHAEALVAEAQRLGLKMYYDIDDPIFDDQTYRANKNLEALSDRERESLLAEIPGYHQLMERVGRVIVSTSGMRELAASSLGPETEIVIWPNLIDSATRSAFDQLPSTADSHIDEVCLGYFSGSRAHDHDLELIAPVLAHLLDKFPQLQLRLGGYTQLPGVLLPYQERIEVIGFMSYRAYLENLRAVDINLVPLLVDRFNACKSGIRYLEASLCAVPTVASAVGQFTEMIVHGETGFLCATEQEWQDELEVMLLDIGLRRRLGEAAQRQVLERYQLHSEDFLPLKEVAAHVA